MDVGTWVNLAAIAGFGILLWQQVRSFRNELKKDIAELRADVQAIRLELQATNRRIDATNLRIDATNRRIDALFNRESAERVAV